MQNFSIEKEQGQACDVAATSRSKLLMKMKTKIHLCSSVFQVKGDETDLYTVAKGTDLIRKVTKRYV